MKRCSIAQLWTETHRGNLEILDSPLIDKVEDIYGWTPLHYFIQDKRVTKEWFKKKYPWIKLKKKKITIKLLDKVLSMSNAEKFILSS